MTTRETIARHHTAEGLRDPVTIKGRLNAVKAVLGNEPVSVLEKAEPIQRFKASYRHGHAAATVNRALSALRGAINWGMGAPTPAEGSRPNAISWRARQDSNLRPPA